MADDDKKTEEAASPRDDVMAAFDELEKQEATDGDGQDTQDGVGKASDEPAPETDGAESASPEKDVAADKAGDDEAAEADAASEQGDVGDVRKEAQTGLAAPAHFSTADKAEFAGLSPAQQQWWIDKDKSLRRADSARDAAVQPFKQVADQAAPYFQQIGADPATHIGNLLQTEYTLRTGTDAQKRQVIEHIAKQYGVQMDDAGVGEGGLVDPNLQPVIERLQSFEQRFATREQQEAMARKQDAERQIREFEEATDTSGQPAHPFFGQVQTDMARVAAAYQAQGQAVPPLKELYDAACAMNPDVRQEMTEAHMKAAEAAMAAKNAEAVKAAKKASKSISGSGASKAPKADEADPKTTHDAVSQAYDALSGEARV